MLKPKSIRRMVKGEITLFLLILFSNIIISGSFYPLLYIVAALLHECGHLIAMQAFGRGATEIKFVGFGIRIKGDGVFSFRQELIIAAMGPVLNFLIGGISALFSLFARLEMLDYFILSNVVYGFLNLVPLEPFDGYKILSNVLYLRFSYQSARKILRIMTLFITILLFILLIISCTAQSFNLSLILILIVLIVCAILRLIVN